MTEKDILAFWFVEISPKQWWVKDTAFDEMVLQRFHEIHHKAIHCELASWRTTAQGRLAEIIILDQFSRNMFRDDPRSFAADPLALGLAQEAIALGMDEPLSKTERSFLYMPFMHSESLLIHETALGLFEKNGEALNLEFEIKHKQIIERFGRYPHRNATLNRESTEEEKVFLTQPGSSF